MDLPFSYEESLAPLSTAELLNIVRNPDAYEPAALDAAQRILATRTVSEGDEQAAAFLLEPNRVEAAIAERTRRALAAAEEWAAPLQSPAAAKSIATWIKVVLILLVLQCLDALFYWVRGVINLFHYHGGPPPLDFYLLDASNWIIELGVPLLTIYLVAKRRRWGWILLVVDCVCGATTSLAYRLEMWAEFHQSPFTRSIFWLVIDLGYFLFLLKRGARECFSVSSRLRNRVLLVCIALVAIYIAAFMVELTHANISF